MNPQPVSLPAAPDDAAQHGERLAQQGFAATGTGHFVAQARGEDG